MNETYRRIFIGSYQTRCAAFTRQVGEHKEVGLTEGKARRGISASYLRENLLQSSSSTYGEHTTTMCTFLLPSKSPRDLRQLKRMQIHPMHRLRKPAIMPIQAPHTSHRALHGQRKRTMVPINALRIIALMPSLARRLARDNT